MFAGLDLKADARRLLAIILFAKFGQRQGHVRYRITHKELTIF